MPERTRPVTASGGTYPLGSSEVARIGYGAMPLRSLTADPAKAKELLKYAVEHGINHIDTAEFYGDGFVNRLIRDVVPKDGSVIIATKVGAAPAPGAKVPLRMAQRPEELRASVEDNLASLGMESLPVVNLRRADGGPGLRAEGDQIVAIEDQMAELIALRTEGKIQSIGLSAVNVDSLKRVLSAGIACIQNAYSLVSREDEDLLTMCLEHRIAWVPFFPLGGAFPGWPKVTEQSAVIGVAGRLGVTPSQVGLAWLWQHKPNILLIPGTANGAHLKENLASAQIVLDEQAISELEAGAASRQ